MKIKTIFTIGLVALAGFSFGQAVPVLKDSMVKPKAMPGITEPMAFPDEPVKLPQREEVEIFTRTEIPATFPGGKKNFNAFADKNLNTDVPIDNNAPAGIYDVIVRFVVSKTGTVSDIVAETHHGYGMELEAIRIMKRSPQWNAAVQNGYKVNAYTRQVIHFKVP